VFNNCREAAAAGTLHMIDGLSKANVPPNTLYTVNHKKNVALYF